ncbi:General control protein [Gnomoniopsis smithogilvyi]|uniref:General control protein n=1 Tax=Gnomoniopsis smithogilvyi TaxID=1191159 RepID=A0A9W8YX55_9PEZI|nr:General control protein [Gnomoniopsis smithogilvyi]
MASLQCSQPAGTIRATFSSTSTTPVVRSGLLQLHFERHQRQQQLHNAANAASNVYSNSAPPSAAAVNRVQQPSKSNQRPPVPLFNLPNGKMELGNSPRLMPLHEALYSHSRPDIDLPHVPFGGGALSEFSSPADPVFDNFHVSPEQLFMDVNMSAPNSEALTCLTTPSSGFDASPAYSDWNTSPLFAANDDASQWPSLFPETTTVAAPIAEVEQSPVIQSEEVQPVKKPASSRKSSSTGNSPSARPSSLAGVNASRRRSKPLPPIHVDDAADEKSMKRARNTLAARKSRARRQTHIEELEQAVKELEARLEKTEQERDHYKALYESR